MTNPTDADLILAANIDLECYYCTDNGSLKFNHHKAAQLIAEHVQEQVGLRTKELVEALEVYANSLYGDKPTNVIEVQTNIWNIIAKYKRSEDENIISL